MLRKIRFKNFKGHFYIDKMEYDVEGNRMGRNIYDQNKNFLNYVYYPESEEIKRLRFCKTPFDFFDHFCDSYDYGFTPREIMETYCDDIQEGYDCDFVLEETKEIMDDLNTLTDKELCKTYDILKIETIYFRGNW